ncbi:S8 family peptidase [Cohnella yongneupensis]|uniref:S8 family peptidase n=1 Tax=Cohnella yongneupensis TaxID=425006 RepID=A0ABW0R366_9BACL
MNDLAAHLRACARRKPTAKTERLIVRFKHKRDYRACRKHLAAKGVHPVKAYSALRMLCYHADRQADKSRLRAHPRVVFVERDRKAKAHGSVSIQSVRIPWNISRVQAPKTWIPANKGKGVKVGIVDTGIARHPDLRIAGGVNTLGGKSFADDNGHGTHVAGIAAAIGTKRIFGAAPSVKLYAVKVLDASGEGFVSDIVEGIEWCLSRGIQVMNMSFGLSNNSQALRAAIRRARRKGAIMVASAGNDGPSNLAIDYPARYPETIAVAATERNNKIASFSSRGRGIDLAAPGVNIYSTWLGGKYAYESGTSMSSPHVTGGAALLKAIRPCSAAGDIIRRLKASAKPIETKRSAGNGLLQIAKAAKSYTGQR